jgi:exodeoxyribonuclease VII large subunit
MNIEFTVSDFVAVFNQTVEYAFPSVTIVGELSNFRVSKGRWVYFDLKDEFSSVKFFGTIYMMPGPLEDGMVVRVIGTPRLHNMFGFSINARSITPVGEGSIKKASELLRQKLDREGLFAKERKRLLPYPPAKIGLIASSESAAYVDFTKVLQERWGGIEILVADVLVQGDSAPSQIASALQHLNTVDNLDVIVITRGGGSADDLQVFNTEVVVRAVAASRIPTLVAIGHEIDISLSELAADKRASTPSNAAEVLVPDKYTEVQFINSQLTSLPIDLLQRITAIKNQANFSVKEIQFKLDTLLSDHKSRLNYSKQLLNSFDPRRVLRMGYAAVQKQNGKRVLSVSELSKNDHITLRLHDGTLLAMVVSIDLVPENYRIK